MEVSSALSVTRRKFFRKFSRNCSKNSTTFNGDDFGTLFCLFWHKKIWFQPTYTNDFSWKNLAQIHQILKEKNSKLPDFYDKFHYQVAKDIEGFCDFLHSYLVCSQIWLNHLVMIVTSARSKKLKKKTLLQKLFSWIKANVVRLLHRS